MAFLDVYTEVMTGLEKSSFVNEHYAEARCAVRVLPKRGDGSLVSCQGWHFLVFLLGISPTDGVDYTGNP